jgi:hypothetical protein
MGLINVKQFVEWELAGETELIGQNPTQYQSVHHKSPKTLPEIEPGPPRW